VNSSAHHIQTKLQIPYKIANNNTVIDKDCLFYRGRHGTLYIADHSTEADTNVNFTVFVSHTFAQKLILYALSHFSIVLSNIL